MEQSMNSLHLVSTYYSDQIDPKRKIAFLYSIFIPFLWHFLEALWAILFGSCRRACT